MGNEGISCILDMSGPMYCLSLFVRGRDGRNWEFNMRGVAWEAMSVCVSTGGGFVFCVTESRGVHQADLRKFFEIQPDAWTTTHAILQSRQATLDSRLFAATTLKGKVCFTNGRSLLYYSNSHTVDV